MFAKNLSLVVMAVAILAAAQVSGGIIVQDTFTGADNTLLSVHAPDVNLPGGAWGANGNVSAWGEPMIKGNAAFVNPDMGAGIPLTSAGSYTKPTSFTISADMTITTLDANPDRIGLGFYSYVVPWQTWAIQNFKGLLLTRDGTLQYVSNDGATTTVLQSVAWSGIGGAGYVTGAMHTLSYDVNTLTGRITGVSLSGSNANFSAITGDTSNTLTDNATTRAGFLMDGYATGKFDNFMVAGPVPEPTALVLLASGLLGCAWRRRQ